MPRSPETSTRRIRPRQVGIDIDALGRQLAHHAIAASRAPMRLPPRKVVTPSSRDTNVASAHRDRRATPRASRVTSPIRSGSIRRGGVCRF